jgi:hypothetical protein
VRIQHNIAPTVCWQCSFLDTTALRTKRMLFRLIQHPKVNDVCDGHMLSGTVLVKKSTSRLACHFHFRSVIGILRQFMGMKCGIDISPCAQIVSMVIGLFPLVKNRVSTGAQCLVLCSPMAPPPLLPALCYDQALYHREFVTFAYDICSYTAQSLYDLFWAVSILSIIGGIISIQPRHLQHAAISWTATSKGGVSSKNIPATALE